MNNLQNLVCTRNSQQSGRFLSKAHGGSWKEHEDQKSQPIRLHGFQGQIQEGQIFLKSQIQVWDVFQGIGMQGEMKIVGADVPKCSGVADECI